jgi:hypothetical protein
MVKIPILTSPTALVRANGKSLLLASVSNKIMSMQLTFLKTESTPRALFKNTFLGRAKEQILDIVVSLTFTANLFAPVQNGTQLNSKKELLVLGF